MSDEINREVNDFPPVNYPIQKIYFGQNGERALLQFDVIPQGSGLEDKGEIGSGSPDEEQSYYISNNVLSPDVQSANGNLFWDRNGRLVRGSCLYNTSVKGDNNANETMLSAYSSDYFSATAQSSTGDDVETIGRHIGNIPNKYNSTQEILAGGVIPEGGTPVGHSNSDIIEFTGEEYEAQMGYYGTVVGYDASGNVVMGSTIAGTHGPQLKITGLSADCIKRGVKYFGVMGTFAGTLGTLSAQSYIDGNFEYSPAGTEYDGWNKVTTSQVLVHYPDPVDGVYTCYIGEVKPE